MKSGKKRELKTNDQDRKITMVTFAVGYAIVWIAVVFYVGWIAQRQRRLAKRYETLQKQIEAEQGCRATASRAA
jgi:CcmD family protein